MIMAKWDKRLLSSDGSPILFSRIGSSGKKILELGLGWVTAAVAGSSHFHDLG